MAMSSQGSETLFSPDILKPSRLGAGNLSPPSFNFSPIGPAPPSVGYIPQTVRPVVAHPGRNNIRLQKQFDLP